MAVPETLRGDFVLRVKGDSMINAGILDGDRGRATAQEARNGEIVVALAGDDESADEATVKRFFREKGRRGSSPRTTPSSRSTHSTSRSWPSDGSIPLVVSSVAPFHRTLEQELQAPARRQHGVPCLRQFVLQAGWSLCPECNSSLREELGGEETRLQFDTQAG